MRENFFPVWMIVCFGLMLSVAASAQSADKSAKEQTRRVKNRVLTSTYLPPIRIKFDKNFKHLGSQKFILYERAQAEQFYFVDADDGQSIKRMYIVQFEGYLPNINKTYNYPVANTVELAGQSYSVESHVVPSVSSIVKKYPESDTARAVLFLEGKGYRGAESVLFQRFVRLVDESRRNEFLIFYFEDLSESGFTAADLPKDGRAFSQRGKILQELLSRALKGFTVLK